MRAYFEIMSVQPLPDLPFSQACENNQAPILSVLAQAFADRRRVLETIPFDKIKFVGYAFQIEMKFTAWKYGFRIIEVPIIFTDRTLGASKMSKSIFREAILGVVELKAKSWFRSYK